MQAVTSLMSLRTFSLTLPSQVSTSTLREILALQNITTLSLQFLSQEQRLPPCTTGLRQLYHLTITADLAYIGDFIGCVSSNRLKFLHVTHIRSPGTHDTPTHVDELWRDLFKLISRWTHSLKFLYLYDLDGRISHPPAQPSYALLDELLALRALHRLRLSMNLKLLDGDVRRTATSWPDMHTLEIYNGKLKSPTRLSLAALETIADLSIPSLDLSSLSEPVHAKSHSLQKLTSGSVSFQDALLVAQNLDALFSAVSLDSARLGDRKRWADVERILGAFRSVKKKKTRKKDCRVRCWDRNDYFVQVSPAIEGVGSGQCRCRCCNEGVLLCVF